MESDGLLSSIRKESEGTPFKNIQDMLIDYYSKAPEYSEPVIWMTIKQKEQYIKVMQNGK